MDQNERPQYYEGQYLGAEDLAAAVSYARVGQARHALGAHTWGIALGLELIERPHPGGDVEITLTPGYAWDGIGRPIVALAPAKVGLTLFENFQDDTDAAGIPVAIWLSYRELPTKSSAQGFAACRDGQLVERVIEGYRIEALRVSTVDFHGVTVAARAIDAKSAVQAFNPAGKPLYDESVSYQEFPESGDRPRWRIFAGIVRWVKEVNQTARLIPRTDDDLNATRRRRRYIGVVAEAIQAAGGVLRLRDRANDPDDATLNFQPPVVKPGPGEHPDNDLVWVEGNLRVVGDARIVAGKVDYRLPKGGDGGVSVWLRRVDAANPQKTTLEAAIGAPAGVETRFAVSALDANGNATPRMTVVAGTGNVGVGTEAPTQLLTLGGDGGTRLEIGRVSAAFPWSGTAPDNPGGFAINQQSAGSSNVGADLALKRDGKLRVMLGNTSTFVSSQDGGDILLLVNQGETGEKEVMRATAAGNVGIGTPFPAATLALGGDLELDQTGIAAPRSLHPGATLVWNDGTWLRLNQNRDFSKPIFGVHTPGVFASGSLNVGGAGNWADPAPGNLWITGRAFKDSPGPHWEHVSDARLKKDIAPIEGALERILGLRGVSFAWREPEKHGASPGRYMGMVAQEVERVFPDWVRDTPAGVKTLNPVGFEALAVEALRELSAKCERLEEEIARLKKRGRRAAEPRDGDVPPRGKSPKK
ncbi:MAG TPA: tail fiber domain-containing protein [Burkholderiales bacterium]|nr:tail fiber domain-containing protein [Burkholderiales bacterium]